MIVTPDNIAEVCGDLYERPVISIDTETTGLRVDHGDRPFSLILAEFYFDLASLINEPLEDLHRVLAGERVWVGHNLKFDIAMLEAAGFPRLRGFLHCTQTVERILDDQSMGHALSLERVGFRYGAKKNKEVEEYIIANKLYTMVQVPGKKQKERRPHYDQVPFDIITRYGLDDTKAAMTVARAQRARIRALDGIGQPEWPKLWDLYNNEARLLGVVYDMERQGVAVDREFCARAIKYEQNCQRELDAEFVKETGERYRKSNKFFQKIFADEKDRWTYTEKGNPSFSKDHLQYFTNPAAQIICKHSQSKANINYYLGFLYHADSEGLIRSSMGQHVARTGRFSSAAPNLQNLKARGLDLRQEFLVRRAIVPRGDNYFCMIDYDQVEYRIMADYAQAMGLIDLVNNGLDVHSATAEIAGVTRAEAKNVNFGIVYGQGDASLAIKLGVSKAMATDIRRKILAAAPEIDEFIERVKEIARKRGYIFNWMGRRYHYKHDDYYKAPNGLIQGSAADVIKCAMIRCVESVLANYKTKLVLCVHDELVFEGPEEEMLTVPPLLKEVMENVFPHRHLKLTAGIDVSLKSLADKMPFEEVVA